MVAHDILVKGVSLTGREHTRPMLLQMNDDDFPAHFLQDLASSDSPPISSAKPVNRSDPLYQPVQRMVTVALVDLQCDTIGYPPVDPKRILSSGLVIRRVYRLPGSNGTPIEDYDTLSAWMRSAQGRYSWVKLSHSQDDCDPDPTKRPQLQSGQAALDRQLTAQYLSSANTETTSPAFIAPPATCAALGRTVVYAVIPTASSEASDIEPKTPPSIDRHGLVTSLPALLRSKKYSGGLTIPAPPTTIDYRWMSDEFLSSQYAPTMTRSASNPNNPPTFTPDPSFTWFHTFATTLRMLHTAFDAFSDTTEAKEILNVLNRRHVKFSDGRTQHMGDFYRTAKTALLDYNGYPSPTGVAPAPPTNLPMPASWGSLTHEDEKDLVDKLIAALTPASKKQFSPQGRFQDSTRYYKLRLFFRIKNENPACPPELVWSQYSDHFKIAPWHAPSERALPPIPLPDPTKDFINSAKPNCSFQVPGNLMSAIQGSSLSGLMNGAGGGGGLSLGWICGFSIPLITICAFFVLNIFLTLLNIVFFWLPVIKICIPFPSPSPGSPDDGAP
jgi:hypothetical protein